MTVLCTRIPRSSFSSLTYNPEFCFLQIIFFCELNNQALLTHEEEVGCMIRRDILRYHCLSLTEFWYKVLCVLSFFSGKSFKKYHNKSFIFWAKITFYSLTLLLLLFRTLLVIDHTGQTKWIWGQIQCGKTHEHTVGSCSWLNSS